MEVQELYARGERLLKGGDCSQAEEVLAAVVRARPDHACAHHLLGKARAGLGRWEEAEALQRRSCELDPSLGWNAFTLAELLQERGAWEEAQLAFEAASKSLPKQPWIQERARRLARRLEWETTRGEPRFSLEQLVQMIWLLRPDLRQQYAGDQDELWIWLLLEGPQEYLGAVVLRDDLIAHLRRQGLLNPAVLTPLGLPKGVEPPISRLLQAIWLQQRHLRSRFDLETLAGRVGLFWWFVLEAVEHYQLQALLGEAELDYLHAAEMPQVGARSVPRLALAVRRHLGKTIADEQLHDWFFETAVRQFQLGELLCDRRIAAWGIPVAGLSRRVQRPASLPVHPVSTASLPFGVNVIGYAEGQLGIGEDLRMAVQALDSAGVPCSVVNVNPDPSIDCADRSVSERISDQMPYACNLFCLTGIETARVAISETVPLMLPGRVNIGAWPWEFARWPAHWAVAYSLVDEIWAGSVFSAQAYKSDDALPVEFMPMVVDVTPSAGLTRADFGLPEADYLFVFAFDCSSSMRRKNPWAVLQAFQLAFPVDGAHDVGLVVKVMRASSDHPAYQRLRYSAAADPRIHLIEETLPRAAVLDLYRCCDGFVSLHRSEGFGRAIAEAMFLGKAVIATAYSGNLDFCEPSTALLIPFVLQPLWPGEYPEADGLFWADPDLSAAAEAMRRCAERCWRPDDAAVCELKSRYSAVAVGANYKDRLESLLLKSYSC
mgnify:CR=1 FL=1